MKVLYTSDLHGGSHLYEELISVATTTSPEILILGGDFLPSFPPTKRYEDMVPNQRAFIEQSLLPFFRRIREAALIQQILLIPGNWDLGYPYVFKESMPGIIDLTQKSYQIKNGYEFIGCPFVPPTPFRPKNYERMDDRKAPWPPQKIPSYIFAPNQTDELTPIDPYLYLRQRETIEEELNRLPQPVDQKKTVYVMHSPPFETRLDLIQGGAPAGSRSIKTFIERNQPLLTLHGHIHESPECSGAYFDHIGKTLSINPGQSAWAVGHVMKLDAVTFEMENIEGTLRHTRYPLTPSPAYR